MTKKGLRFPHTISYRLTDEDFLKLEQEVNKTALLRTTGAALWCWTGLIKNTGCRKIQKVVSGMEKAGSERKF